MFDCNNVAELVMTFKFKVNNYIYDILDIHDVLQGQYRKRIQFYEQCGYQIKTKRLGEAEYRARRKKHEDSEESSEVAPAGKPLFKS